MHDTRDIYATHHKYAGDPVPDRPSLVPPPDSIYTPNIQNGDMDGATEDEFTGMRAEFTSKRWFEYERGRQHRRLYSWYGYHGGNMSWYGFLTLIRKVHFRDEPDMKIPTRAQRMDRSRGTRLTNMEKCLVAKMFFTTGLAFTKLADLWSCSERTIAKAVDYWDSKWQEVARRYCRLRVFRDYLLACQPAGWEDRYKIPISHLEDGSVVATNTPRKSSALNRLMLNTKIEHAGALGITQSTPTGCGFL